MTGQGLRLLHVFRGFSRGCTSNVFRRVFRLSASGVLGLVLCLTPGSPSPWASEPDQAGLPKPAHKGEPTDPQASTIVQSLGVACMGDEYSRSQTRDKAFTRARRNAQEMARTHVASTSTVSGNILRRDIIRAYSTASVRVVRVLERAWYSDPRAGQCHRIRLLAEVIPRPSRGTDTDALPEDPTLPLTIRLWTDKETYREGEAMRVYLRGNKPFYARVVYTDVTGELIQLLPNPMRRANRFDGGTVYLIPEVEDAFDLKVMAPFGPERITVFACTRPMGTIVTTQNKKGLLLIREHPEQLPIRLRSIGVMPRHPSEADAQPPGPVEFFQTSQPITTSE